MNKKIYLVLIPLLITACSVSKEEKDKSVTSSISVNSATVEISEVVGAGKVEPEKSIVSLASAIGGIVTDIYRNDGDSVRKGEPLVRLDNELEMIRVSQLKNQYVSQKSQADIDKFTLKESEARLANKKRLLESVISLASKGAETRQTLDDLETEVTQLSLAVEKDRATVALSDSRLREIADQVKFAEAEADKKIMRSPYDGLLLDLLTEKGSAVNQYETYAEIAPSGSMTVRTEVDELFAGRLREVDSAVRAAARIDFEAENTRSLIKIHDVFAEYELNQGQSELVNRLDKFLSTRDESIFLLKGYAGTGKTFITKGLTEYFRAIGRNFVLVAPTGKASKVISTKTGAGASTIHSAIYSFKDIVEYRDEDEDGTETYKFYADLAANDLSADTVFIVDEASMVSDNYQEAEFFRFGSGFLLRDLLKYVNLDHNDHRKKIIFIGDNAQLPPVGMSSSPALSSDYLKRQYHLGSTEYELKEVVRQKSDSGVIENSIRLRDAISTKVFNQLTIAYSKPGVEKIEHRDFMPRYLEACNGRISANAIVIAHSNSDVAEFNQRIRGHFFPESAEVARGDKIMAVTNTDTPGFFISNGDFGMVWEVLGEPESRIITLKAKRPDSKERVETPVTLTFRSVILAFRDQDGALQKFQANIIEDLLYSSEANLSSDQTKALYIDFRIRNSDLKPRSVEFKNALRTDPYFNAIRLKFGYAITCHKAQGSEWEHVFVKCKSHHNQLSADYFRWFYTAITRTSKSLYLLDAPDIKLGAGIKRVGNSQIGPALPSRATDLGTPSPGDESMHSVDAKGTLGIPESEHLLLAILGKVRALMHSLPDVEIDDIVHNQYRESYFFTKDGQRARIDVSYNGKGKVTGVGAHRPSEFSTSLVELLSPLKGALIVVAASAPSEGPAFEQEFLEIYHLGLTARMEGKGITVDSVQQQEWRLRYTFRRADEIAVIDIFYNGKHQFTKYAPVGPMSNSKALLSDVTEVLAHGFD